MLLENISNIVVVLATVSTLLCHMRQNKKVEQHAFVQTNSLSSSINSFFKQVDLLEDASLNYFNTLNDAGLKDLIYIRDQLKTIIQDRDNLVKQGKNYEANLLVEFLNSPHPKPYKKLSELTSAKLDKLDNWKEISQNRIMNCVIQLGISSNKPSSASTNNAQLSRANRRRATFCTLNELKEIITEQRTH
jgi:hypothetical protein